MQRPIQLWTQLMKKMVLSGAHNTRSIHSAHNVQNPMTDHRSGTTTWQIGTRQDMQAHQHKWEIIYPPTHQSHMLTILYPVCWQCPSSQLYCAYQSKEFLHTMCGCVCEWGCACVCECVCEWVFVWASIGETSKSCKKLWENYNFRFTKHKSQMCFSHFCTHSTTIPCKHTHTRPTYFYLVLSQQWGLNTLTQQLCGSVQHKEWLLECALSQGVIQSMYLDLCNWHFDVTSDCLFVIDVSKMHFWTTSHEWV